MFVLFNLISAFPSHELNKRQLDKLSYVLTDSISDQDEKNESINGLSIEENSDNQMNKLQTIKSPLQSTTQDTSDKKNQYSNLVDRIVKQILSRRSKNKLVNDHRRHKNVKQIKKNDLINSSLIDKKFKLLSELTFESLKPSFVFDLPDMTPEEHDELVNDINKMINEDDSSFRRRE